MTMGRGKFFQACGYIFGKTVFAPCGGTWWAYSIRPYPTGRRCLLFIPTTFTTHPGFFVVHLSFFDVPRRGVSHTPSRRPARGGGMTMGRTSFDVPCRGVLHTPHKRPGRGDLIYLWVGVFIPAGYIWGVFNTPLPYRQKKRRVRSWISPRVPGFFVVRSLSFLEGSFLFLP